MIKLSEIIRTDCYIDCGSNEKLRDVYPLIELEEYRTQKSFGIVAINKFVLISGNIGLKGTTKSKITGLNYPIHHISQIDLNG